MKNLLNISFSLIESLFVFVFNCGQTYGCLIGTLFNF